MQYVAMTWTNLLNSTIFVGRGERGGGWRGGAKSLCRDLILSPSQSYTPAKLELSQKAN